MDTKKLVILSEKEENTTLVDFHSHRLKLAMYSHWVSLTSDPNPALKHGGWLRHEPPEQQLLAPAVRHPHLQEYQLSLAFQRHHLDQDQDCWCALPPAM